MKKLNLCVAGLCLFATLSVAQTNLRFVDIRSAGTGGNGVTNSILTNPACLSLSTSQSIHINYFNKYQLKELSSVSALYANPESLLPFAAHISSFGYSRYRESLFRLAFSKVLASNWIAGVSVQYSLLQTELFEEEAKKVSTDVGILFIPDENLLIGLSITDFPSVRLDDKNIHIEDFNYYSIQTGCQWNFINSMLIAVSVSYGNHSDIRLNAGMEYTAYEVFFVRAGIQSKPVIPAFGAGVKIASFCIDVAVNYHNLLGACPGVGLSYSF